jgi:lipopolysaccharide export system protein LptC
MERPALPTLGPAPGAGAAPMQLPWTQRLRDALSAYLPLLLMALLALATWWLVKNTPGLTTPSVAVPKRHEADYVMQRFTLQRFAPDGRLAVQIEGDQMRHYPDTDTLEVDGVRIRAFAPDGGLTLATARRALSNGDASEVQLLGDARVRSEGGAKAREPLVFEGEFLHAFLNTERLRSHLPVLLHQGTSEIRAAGLDYDNLTRVAQLKGPVRARLAPPR